MRRLVLRPEFGAGPIWDDDWDGEQDTCPTPESLGLSPRLCADLWQWQADYDATLDDEYPPDSRFPSSEAYAAWRERGSELGRRLQVELGEAAIVRLSVPDT